MTYQPSQTQYAALKKHNRAILIPATRQNTPVSPAADAVALTGSVTEAAPFAGLDLPWWQYALKSAAGALAVWRKRSAARQHLASIDARTLAEAGIDPGAAAFEAAKPFWKPLGLLRFQ